jgi:hypothetical protein
LLKHQMPPRKAIRLPGIPVSGLIGYEPEDEAQFPLSSDDVQE